MMACITGILTIKRYFQLTFVTTYIGSRGWQKGGIWWETGLESQIMCVLLTTRKNKTLHVGHNA